LCVESVWLENGAVARLGPSYEVIDAYLSAQAERSAHPGFTGGAGKAVDVESLVVKTCDGRPRHVFPRSQPFIVELTFTLHSTFPGLDVGIYFTNSHGVDVLGESWADTAPVRPSDPGRYVARLQIPPVLAGGDYVLGVWIGSAYETLVHEPAAQRIRLDGSEEHKKRVVHLELPWDVQVHGMAEATGHGVVP
jgi:Wzt C-terminal domain